MGNHLDTFVDLLVQGAKPSSRMLKSREAKLHVVANGGTKMMRNETCWQFHNLLKTKILSSAIILALTICHVQAMEPLQGAVIDYELPNAARVSLAIYDCHGKMVRTLLTGKPQAAGRHTAHWDGLDRYGHALPNSEYVWKLVATNGLRAEFITQIGQNVDPLWERATGNHEAPVGAAIDLSGLYRVGATNEGGHYAVKTDLKGKHLWAVDRYSADPWAQGTVAVALVSDRLFELLPNGDVYGYDAKTGKVFTGGNYDPKPWNLCWEGYLPPEGTSDEEKRKLRAMQCPADIASDPNGNWILAAYPQHSAIAWYSAKDGKLAATVRDISDLSGIAVCSDGTSLAISGGAVVAIRRDGTGTSIRIPSAQLEHPWRLSVDHQSGDILVAENSFKASDAKAHHQVKRFDSTGKLLKIYGAPAGRIDGAYIAADFRGITDIEADIDGGFIVTEGNHTPPRRTARFDRDGHVLREWLGCQHYGVLACPEPGNPSFVWTRANAKVPGLLRWKVDYKNKTSELVEVYQDTFALNRFFGNNSAHGSAVPTVIQHDKRLYIYNGAMGSLVLLRYDPITKQISPCNASAGTDGRAIIWNDLNDDGQVSDDEIHQTNRNIVGGYIHPADMSIRTTPTATRFQAGHLLKPRQFTAKGTPIYDSRDASRIDAWRENGDGFHPFDFRQANDGSLYGSISDATRNPNEGNETHGAWYYNSCSAVDRLVRWGSNGEQLWSVGRHSPDNDHETGSTAMPRGLVGLVHGCVVWADASDEEVARPTVWTEDGLYIDELLRVPMDNIPKEVYGMFNTNEYPSGHLSIDPSTGDTLYYAISSGGGSSIYRITGWDPWYRDSGKLTLDTHISQTAKLNGTGLKAEYFNSPDCSGEPVVTRTDPLVFFNWGKNPPDERLNRESFSVRWTGQYESATNEDTRFEVRGNFPWRDRGKPIFTKMWLNGNLVMDSQDEHTYVRVRLSAGQRVDLRLECGFKKGDAAVALSHDTPGLDRRAVLPIHLHPMESGQYREIEVLSDKRPELLAHFNFEQSLGPLYWSLTSGDIWGRLTGACNQVDGVVGNAVELTANGEFAPAAFPIDEELQLPDSDYSISFWFRTTEKNIQLCEARRYSSYNNRWSDHLLQIEDGKLRFRLKQAKELSSPIQLSDGQWHHVLTCVGTNGHMLYLDGVLVDNGEMVRRTTSSNRLGLDLGPARGHGSVAFDELIVLAKNLSSDEVYSLYSKKGLKP
jgi:hypothetical protein